jgi:hypothetical protein
MLLVLNAYSDRESWWWLVAVATAEAACKWCTVGSIGVDAVIHIHIAYEK